MLSQDAALEAAREIMQGPRAAELARLDRIAQALTEDAPAVILPAVVDPKLAALAAKSRTNLLPLVVSSFAQGLEVVGASSQGSLEAHPGWRAWSRNGFDARQEGVHRGALTYGTAYVRLLPGDTGVPVLRGRSPRKVTALYADPEDDWPMLALEVDGNLVMLYDEQHVYRFGVESGPCSAILGLPRSTPIAQTAFLGTMVYLDTVEHGVTADGGVPVCPFVRYRDSMLLAGEEQLGIIEPLITIQDRIDETVFGGLVAQYVAAFAQQYIAGWVPANESEKLQAAVSQVWTFSDPQTKVGQLDGTDPERYIRAKVAAIRDLAGRAQLPAQSLGDADMVNVSAETLAMLQAEKQSRLSGFQTSLGESHEQLLRAAAENTTGLEGEDAAAFAAAAVDYDVEVRWADRSPRSFAAVVDGLGKLAQMLKVPVEGLWSMVPGVTDATVEQWKALGASQDSVDSLMRLLDGQAAGVDASAFTAADAGSAGGVPGFDPSAAAVPPGA